MVQAQDPITGCRLNSWLQANPGGEGGADKKKILETVQSSARPSQLDFTGQNTEEEITA